MATRKENINFLKLTQLLIEKGSDALRAAFHGQHPSSNLADVLKVKRPLLEEIKGKVIKLPQWELLYPTSGTPNSQNFDVTLLTILLKKICNFTEPNTGWNTMPSETDTSTVANIVRIKNYRNKVVAHAASAYVDDKEFETLWENISKPLVALGVPQEEIDELKEAPLSSDEESYKEQLKEWKEFDGNVFVISEQILKNSEILKEMLGEMMGKETAQSRVNQAEEKTLGHEVSKTQRLGELDEDTYIELCDRLNWNIAGKDWKSLAGRMGYNNNKVKTFERKPDPASELLKYWENTDGNDVLTLIELVRQLKRSDIVELLENALKQ